MSLFHRLTRLWNSAPARNRAKDGRTLFFEDLENRKVMAANFGAIAGTVYSDLTQNGKTADDVAVSGATIKLYKDGGNGVFDNGGGDDTLIGTKTTDSAGKYRFDTLEAGRYYAHQQILGGYIQQAGVNPAIVTITAAQAAGTVGDVVDTFDEDQIIELRANAGPISGSDVALSAKALGGERDLTLNLTSNSGRITLASNVTSPSRLEFSTTLTGNGVGVATWDGVDNSAANVNYTGLGGKDLTKGGTMSGLQLQMAADPNNAVGVIRIYKDQTNFSTYSFNLPKGGANVNETVFIPFASFQTGGGAGADFTQVGAIQLELGGLAGIDGSVDLFTALGPTVLDASIPVIEPLSLGNLVWLDKNNNGVYDAGTEAGIANVLVNLYTDTDGNGAFTAGVDTKVGSTTTNGSGNYLFSNLFPGNYIVQLDAANFVTGGAAAGLQSSTGNQPTPDPDNDVNFDDNGDPMSGQGIVAKAVTLAANAEPTNDEDTNSDSNLTVDFGLFPPIDVQIVKTDNPDPVAAGSLLTYTLDIKNNGPITATGVTVTDILPPEVVYVSSTSSQGTSSAVGSTVTALLGTLGVGATAQVVIIVDVKPDTKGTILNTARVIANEVETNMVNNEDTEPTTVKSEVDLKIEKFDNPDPVQAGAILTYTLLVTNNGPSTATGVIVTDVLPPEVTLQTINASQGTATGSGQNLSANLGTLASGAQATVTITVKVDPRFAGVLHNTGKVKGNEPETDPNNNEDEEPTTVTPIISSISGHVYVDADDDGVLDAGEKLIAGVPVRLTGTNNFGEAVDKVLNTDANGFYLFDKLLPGTYKIVETQPSNYNDGKDTRGTPLLGNVTNDTFSEILLPAAVDAINYDFGEKIIPPPPDPQGDPDPPPPNPQADPPPFSKRRFVMPMNW